MTLAQLRLKLDKVLTCSLIGISRNNIQAMAFKCGMMVLMHGISHFDDLDLDARSQWLGRGNKSALNYLNNELSKL